MINTEEKFNYICLDIGNTTTDFLFYSKNKDSLFSFKEFNTKISYDKLKKIFAEFLKYDLNEQINLYISSVNKKFYDQIFNNVLSKFKINLNILDSKKMEQVNKKLNLKVDNISYLGSDLFADIVYYSKFNKDLIVCDFGTATKILYLDKNKKFHGAIIYPGVSSCSTMLDKSTALLSEYKVEFPKEFISLKTDECVKSGSVYGTYFMTVGLLNKLINDKKIADCNVVFTGGNLSLMKQVAFENGDLNKFIFDEFTTLRGLLYCFDVEIDNKNISKIG